MNIERLRTFFCLDRKNFSSESAQAKAVGIPQSSFHEFMKGIVKFPRGNNLLKMLDYYNQKNGK